MANPRSEKRKRNRQRQAQRAQLAQAAVEAMTEAQFMAQFWEREYFALGRRYGLGSEDQAQRTRLLALNAVPATAAALAERFMGLTLYQWAWMPEELTGPFQMAEASKLWRAQLIAVDRAATDPAGAPLPFFPAATMH